MAMAFLVALALVSVLAAAIAWVWDHAVVRLVWRPYAIGKELRSQGIHGPPYKLVKGSNEEFNAMKEETDGLVLDVHDHNYIPRIAPHYLKWRAQYGEPFLYWFGPKPRLCIFDYELARQILSSKSGNFVKNDPPTTLLDVVGKGLALLDGIDWVRHHRVIKPAFAMDKLKTTMVLLETLRLYGPALFMQRKTVTDMTVGSMKLPKGIAIVIPIPIMHREKVVWGDDAGEFNPLRFENGMTRAGKVPHAMLAFSMGPRSCIGQNFAMLEAKSTLALMLQKFSFTLSHDYVHAPADVFSLKPKFGLPIILRQLDESYI
nr:unnamed protein product [Digitaria exilis]